MKKVLLSALALAATIGCARQVSDDLGSDGLVAIQLGASVSGSVESKAAYNGDVAVTGLQFLRKDAAAGALPTDFSGIVPISGNRTVGTGLIAFDNSQYYLPSGLNAYFVSYYPAASIVSGIATWTIDGKTDVMTSNVVNAGNKGGVLTPVLNYRHELAQIEVILRAASDGGLVQARWGKINQILLRSTPTTMSYAFNGFAVTPSTTTGTIGFASPDYTTPFAQMDIPMSTNVLANAAGMFVPVASQYFALEVHTATEGVKVVTIDLGTGNVLAKGKKHTVTLTFSDRNTNPEITVGSTIDQWGVGANGNGTLN